MIEGPGADDFTVTRRGREVRAGVALAFPTGGNRRESLIGEAPAVGPDPGVQNSDDDVIGVIGVRPEAEGVRETEEVGGASGVDVADSVGEDGEDGGEAAEGGGLGGGEAGGEAVDGGGVGV